MDPVNLPLRAPALRSTHQECILELSRFPGKVPIISLEGNYLVLRRIGNPISARVHPKNNKRIVQRITM
jgi:hypothetical protein